MLRASRFPGATAFPGVSLNTPERGVAVSIIANWPRRRHKRRSELGHDENVRRFTRPHKPDMGMVVTGGLLGFAALFALSVTSALLTVSGSLHPLIFGVYGFVLVLAAIGLRMYRVGVYVSDDALRVRHLLRTRTLRWGAIDHVTSQPARMLGRPTVRHAIWVVPRSGQPFETPIQLEDEFMGAGLRKNSGRRLGPAEYEETLLLLRRRTAAAAPVR